MKEKVNFDNYSNEYNDIMQEQHKMFGDVSYYSEYKAKITKDLVGNKKNLKILEFGCGIGRNLSYLAEISEYCEVYGYDISPESLKIAERENPNAHIITSEQELEEYSESFDLIFIAGVYHHIAVGLRESITTNIRKLLKDDGKLVIFEHNPYNPVTRHLVNTCEFDADAVLLEKSELIKLFVDNNFTKRSDGYALFFPPKLKKLNFLEKYLKRLSLGGQYYVLFDK